MPLASVRLILASLHCPETTSGSGPSGNHIVNHMGVLHAREFVIQAAVEVGELCVIQAEQMQNRRMQVANVVAMLDRFVPQLVGSAARGASLDAAAGQPIKEAFRIVVAAAVLAL